LSLIGIIPAGYFKEKKFAAFWSYRCLASLLEWTQDSCSRCNSIMNYNRHTHWKKQCQGCHSLWIANLS